MHIRANPILLQLDEAAWLSIRYCEDVIWESWYWRSDLLKQAASLRKRLEQKRWPEASLARCEQTIMMGFFAVRKLLDSRKLTEDFSIQQVRVKCYPSTGKHVHLMNYHKLDKLYTFENGRSRTVTVKYLCHQVIHSYVFFLLFDESDRFYSIVVVSDRERGKELLEVPVITIAELFENAAEGEAHRAISYSFDDRVGDYVVRLARKDKPTLPSQ